MNKYDMLKMAISMDVFTHFSGAPIINNVKTVVDNVTNGVKTVKPGKFVAGKIKKEKARLAKEIKKMVNKAVNQEKNTYSQQRAAIQEQAKKLGLESEEYKKMYHTHNAIPLSMLGASGVGTGAIAYDTYANKYGAVDNYLFNKYAGKRYSYLSPEYVARAEKMLLNHALKKEVLKGTEKVAKERAKLEAANKLLKRYKGSHGIRSSWVKPIAAASVAAPAIAMVDRHLLLNDN